MYIYIQEKLAPGAAPGAPPRSAVLEIPAGLVVGVYHDDPANPVGPKIAIPDPGVVAPATWTNVPIDGRPTFKINFVPGFDDNVSGKLSFTPPDADAAVGAVLGGKKRRYHGKTKKSRR